MKIVFSALLFLNLSCSLLTTAQDSSRVAGWHVAQDLLMRLANPRRSDFRVGIVNTAAEFGVLVSPRGLAPTVEYFRGYSTERESTWNLSWTAMEQLDESADSLRFEVVRTKISNSEQCPDLADSLNRFYTELEAVLLAPVLLSAIPQERSRESITVDGTSYIIQIWTGERTLAIHPDRDIDISLDAASAALMGVIGRCSGAFPAAIEEYYGW